MMFANKPRLIIRPQAHKIESTERLGRNTIKSRLAFTLAEVLIVLGILGIVAENTIPTLVASYQKQLYVTQLKAVYSQLGNAMKLMMVEEGVNKVSDTDTLTKQDGEVWADGAQRAGNKFLKKYFKVIKDCGVAGSASANGCFPEQVKYHDSTVDIADSIATGHYCVIIASGASVCVYPARSWSAGYFTLDINGLKKPNTAGRDIFSISFYYDGSLDDAVTPECRKGVANGGVICWGTLTPLGSRNYRADSCGTNSAPAQYGVGCFAKILNAGWKMDY